MTAAVYIPMAKVLDVWGRAEGFALMVGSSTLGLILMAVSQNLATFCAAQVRQTTLNYSSRPRVLTSIPIDLLRRWFCRHHLHYLCTCS